MTDAGKLVLDRNKKPIVVEGRGAKDTPLLQQVGVYTFSTSSTVCAFSISAPRQNPKFPWGSKSIHSTLFPLSAIWETVESVRSLFNSELKVLGILLTRYNRRTLLSRDVDELAAQLADQMGTVVFKSKIRPGVAC